MATEHDKVDHGALATLVVVGVFATLGIALGVDALYRNESTRVGGERAANAGRVVEGLIKEQRAALDAQPMPIERAMSAVVLDLQRNPWSATPPMPEKDAGADAAVETADAGAEDAGVDAGPAADAQGQPLAPAGSAAGSVSAQVPAPRAPEPVPLPKTAEPPTPKAPTAAAPKPPAPAPAAPAPAPAPTAAKPAAPTPTAPPAPAPTDG